MTNDNITPNEANVQVSVPHADAALRGGERGAESAHVRTGRDKAEVSLWIAVRGDDVHTNAHGNAKLTPDQARQLADDLVEMADGVER